MWKQAPFMAALTLVLSVLFGTTAPAQLMGPKRVAVISSSGVRNDFRSWREYDATLSSLKWPFDKYRNTELDKLFQRATDYELILTTSLWNYGDPQDMRPFIPQWSKYVEGGGILVLTDMAYPPMCDWLKDWDKGLDIQYGNAFRDLKGEAVLDTSYLSKFLTTPHPWHTLTYWAHFRHWGDKYKVWARTKGGTAIGLVASLGRGVLIVTTAFGFSEQMLENLYVNAVQLKTEVDIGWANVPTETAPGELQGEISVENLQGQPLVVEVLPFLRQVDGEEVAQGKLVLLRLMPREKRSLPVTLPCLMRGEFCLIARYRT